MNRASLYLRTKGTETEGTALMRNIANMTIGTGINEVEVDLVIELKESAEGDYLNNVVEAVRTGKSNIVIVDRLESFFNSKIESERFALLLIQMGACILIRRENDFVLYRDPKNFTGLIEQVESKRY